METTSNKNLSIYLDHNQSLVFKAKQPHDNKLKNQIVKACHKYISIVIDLSENRSLDLIILETINQIRKTFILDFLSERKSSLGSDPEFFVRLLDTVNNESKKKGLNLKFVFMEFQYILQLSELKILDKMRSVMQHHESITYVFHGESDSMDRIFQSYDSPFFHFARSLSDI